MRLIHCKISTEPVLVFYMWHNAISAFFNANSALKPVRLQLNYTDAYAYSEYVRGRMNEEMCFDSRQGQQIFFSPAAYTQPPI